MVDLSWQVRGLPSQVLPRIWMVSERASILTALLVPPKVRHLAIRSAALADLDHPSTTRAHRHLGRVRSCDHDVTVHPRLLHELTTSTKVRPPDHVADGHHRAGPDPPPGLPARQRQPPRKPGQPTHWLSSYHKSVHGVLTKRDKTVRIGCPHNGFLVYPMIYWACSSCHTIETMF